MYEQERSMLLGSCKLAYEVIQNKYMSRNKKLYRLKKLGFSPQEAMQLIPFNPERDFD